MAVYLSKMAATMVRPSYSQQVNDALWVRNGFISVFLSISKIVWA